MSSRKKSIITGCLVLLSVALTLIYIALSKPDGFSYFPKVINIDSKYYLKRMFSLDYDIKDVQGDLYIIDDTSIDTDFSMGVLSLTEDIIIKPIYKDVVFIDENTIKAWKTETEVSYFDVDGNLLDTGHYRDLKSKYEVQHYEIPEYTVETFESTVYSNDENGNPKKIVGKYVVYGGSTNRSEIVFPLNVSFKDVTIANITGKVFVGDVYDEIYYYSHDDGRVLVKKDNQVYYCDLNGNKIFEVKCNFREDEDGNICFSRGDLRQTYPIYMFDRGQAITVKNDLYGVIDLEGNVLIDFKYYDIVKLPYTLYLASNDDGNFFCDVSLNEGSTTKYYKNLKFLDDKIILYDEKNGKNLVYSIEINV